MTIRKAEEKDILRIIELLGQVLQIHADIRPDIFIPGTTKYTVSQLTELLEKEEKSIPRDANRSLSSVLISEILIAVFQVSLINLSLDP